MDRAGNLIGDYLRVRRELVRPEDVDLPGGGRRKVPGLRREEVAMLADISADYYLRLEQGRERHPSAEVVDALARALRLDGDATSYLHRLAVTAPRGRASPKAERVPVSVLQLIGGWTMNPAYVQNRLMGVLAVNPLATALSPNYAPGVNLLRAVFLDPSERELRRDWEEVTEEAVAALRSLIGPDVDDPRLAELVGELSVRSERFRRLWARYDVVRKKGRLSRWNHPQVGELDLYSNRFSIAGAGDLVLVVFHAEPGSRHAESLGMLGSLAAPERPSAQGTVSGREGAGER